MTKALVCILKKYSSQRKLLGGEKLYKYKIMHHDEVAVCVFVHMHSQVAVALERLNVLEMWLYHI